MSELTSGRRRAPTPASSHLPPSPRRLVLLVIGGVLVLALAAAACLAASLFGGWVLASRVVGFDFMGLWAAFLFGIGIGEIALRITGRKRGRLMEILAGSSVVLGVAGGVAIDLLLHPETAGRAFYLMNPLTYVMLILATISAVGRIRNI